MAATRSRALSVSVTSRRLGLLGLASVAVTLVGIMVTAIAYRGFRGEGYSPLNHLISELGEIAVSRLAWAFNLSLLLGGLGLGTFVLLLTNRLSGRFRAALVAAGVAAGVSGMLVGVFPMDYLATHRIVSGLFFLTGWLIPGIFSLWLLTAARPGLSRGLAVPGGAVTVISLTFLAVFSTYRPANPGAYFLNRPNGSWSVPFLEWASLLSLLTWLACVSLVLLREPTE
jgi:hypothetical membrane protein